MLKKDELSNPNSCLNRAAAEEPVFVLRAHDPRASAIVRAWAVDYRYTKGGVGKMTPAQQGKFTEACALADEMEEWHRAHG